MSNLEGAPRLAGVGRRIGNKFVGPIDPCSFLDLFLPQGPDEQPAFQNEEFYTVGHGDGVQGEADMYGPMIKVLEKYCPNLTLIHTSKDACKKPQPDLIEPGVCAYPKKAGIQRNDISRTELSMQFKWTKIDDAFNDQAVFEDSARRSQVTRLELATYVGAQLMSQFRTHAFSIYIDRDEARLIRWDREGVIVTRRFCYYKKPFLVEFLWRYNHASAETRGHDPSVVEVIDTVRAQEVRNALEMDAIDRVWQFEITDDHGNKHVFLGGKRVHSSAAYPLGQCTRGLVVLNSRGKRCYLKEVWRPLDHDAYQREGDIYAKLKAAGVSHIPDVVASGDAVGHWQTTQTHRFLLNVPVGCSGCRDVQLHIHQHYFIVFGQVGTPINKFKNNFELLHAITDVIQAHKEAYEKARILHRDISPGNMIVTDGGEGLLIDWELSRPLDGGKGKEFRRVGTWEFISADVLLRQSREANQCLADDLESFYHVLCWLTLTRGQHGLTAKEVEAQITRSYHFRNGATEHKATGGTYKMIDFVSLRYMQTQAKLPLGPLATLIYDLENVFRFRYIVYATPETFPEAEDLTTVTKNLGKLESSDWFLGKFRLALREKDLLVQQGRENGRNRRYPREASG
ncbi:hypothetical protein VNI00_007827 [Paramarasmius palmivorus]|uniref:Protein kinase domain-containing protein n=1 Tax=Paramarasmius palmivorus TaxID=297713 RepID=A0AAW0CZC9_9AGAR